MDSNISIITGEHRMYIYIYTQNVYISVGVCSSEVVEVHSHIEHYNALKYKQTSNILAAKLYPHLKKTYIIKNI